MSKDDDPRMQTGTTCVPLPQTLRTNKKKLQKLVFLFLGFFFLFLCKQANPKPKPKEKNPNTTREKTNSRKTNTREELHNQKQQQQQIETAQREREREREQKRRKSEREKKKERGKEGKTYPLQTLSLPQIPCHKFCKFLAKHKHNKHPSSSYPTLTPSLSLSPSPK